MKAIQIFFTFALENLALHHYKCLHEKKLKIPHSTMMKRNAKLIHKSDLTGTLSESFHHQTTSRMIRTSVDMT